MTKRFVCFHGHFYQPPRESPGLEIVEPQPSAAPWRDWNERITSECYRPNSQARVLDAEGRLRAITNNYERLSFDFGPTLMTWLERNARDVHDAIVAGDRAAAARDGHGGALAHPFHHSILPLSDPRDRATELRWGLEDFSLRYGREAEGIWLPETAADVATLEALAERGVAFTVLAPRQARRTRAIGATAWRDVADGSIDTRRAYRAMLPSGRSITIVFYDGGLSQAVAFEHLLDSADRLVERIIGSFDSGGAAQLVSICTDGETYGHHHRFGEMALARAIEVLSTRADVEITTYAKFVAHFPPHDEVEIVSPSAWSCAHGVERWRSDCGCRAGGPEKKQAWRAPLRAALESLRAAIAENFETAAGVLLRDPFAARDDALALARGPTPDELNALLDRHATRPLSTSERMSALELLESQRQALAMFTSCAWFFDDLAGIETLQVLAHADRAIELVARALGVDLTAQFAAALADAKANDPKDGDGERLLRERVRFRRGDPERVARHAAMLALRDPVQRFEVCEHGVERIECASLGVGDASLAFGVVRVRCIRTGRIQEFTHAVIEIGRLFFVGGIAPGADARPLREIETAFARATGDGILALERLLPSVEHPCGLDWLLPMDRERFVEQAFVGDLRDLAAIERRIADGCARIVERLDALGVALPEELQRVRAAQDALALRAALSAERTALRSALERLPRRSTSSGDGLSVASVAQLIRRLVDEIRAACAIDDGGDAVREVHALVKATFAWRPDFGLHEIQAALLDSVRPLLPRLTRLAAHDALARSRLDVLRDVAALLRVDLGT